MDLFVVMLGVILGLVWFIVDQEMKKRRQSATATPQIPAPRPLTPTRINDGSLTRPHHFPSMFPPLQPPIPQPWNPRQTEETISRKSMPQVWRNSIVGLVRLAQRNISSARQCLEKCDFEAAVATATTSVENISRALLHCYGEKPESDSGQEEALKLLVRRFKGSENAGIVKTIEEVNQLEGNKSAYKSLLNAETDHAVNQEKTKTAQSIVELASRVVSRFSDLIREHFLAEIPELAEICPKCHGMEVSVLGFDKSTARCTCAICMHSWNEPRE